MGQPTSSLPAHIGFTRRFKELVASEQQLEVANRLRYSPPRISQIARGERPSRAFVEKLIEVYKLPREEWLALAGYGAHASVEDERLDIARQAVREVMEQYDFRNGADVLFDAVRQLQAEYPDARVLDLLRFTGGSRTLTVAEAEEQIEDLRSRLEAQAQRQP